MYGALCAHDSHRMRYVGEVHLHCAPTAPQRKRRHGGRR